MNIEETSVSLVKGLSEQPTADVTLSGGGLDTYPLRLGRRPGRLSPVLQFGFALGVLASGVGKNKRLQAGREDSVLHSHTAQVSMPSLWDPPEG